MSSIVIKGNTSGQVEITAPDVAGSTTLTLPTGTANLLTADGDGSQLTNLPQPAALSTASGSAPSYSARAWVLFDGGASPTVNGSGNISSVVQVSSGVYGITLANAMPDINYVISNCGWTTNQNTVAQENDPVGHRTTTYFEVVYESVGAVKINNTYNSVMVLR